jgi:hypothetical protein
VNREGKVFNRKLSKYMKAFEYASTVEVNYSKNHYTRHGFYLKERKRTGLGNSRPLSYTDSTYLYTHELVSSTKEAEV